jgi:hypothetical protein
MRKVVVIALIVAALLTAAVGAVLILRLPKPPTNFNTNNARAVVEYRYGTLTNQNRERRDEYLSAAGLLIFVLLGSALVLSLRPRD